MKIILFVLSLTGSLAFANVSTGDMVSAKVFNESTLSVGTIQQSLLSQAQFQSLQGNCWVKMEGQDISGSDFAQLTGDNTLPNASGRFLRATGVSTTGGDEVLLGELQEDEFIDHSHQLRVSNEIGGSRDGWGTSNSGPVGDRSSTSTLNSYPLGNTTKKGISSNTANPIRSAHGGVETRPKNIGVNFFIKINHECN